MNDKLISEALYLFIHGDEIDEYPGWIKKGKVWHYEGEWS